MKIIFFLFCTRSLASSPPFSQCEIPLPLQRPFSDTILSPFRRRFNLMSKRFPLDNFRNKDRFGRQFLMFSPPSFSRGSPAFFKGFALLSECVPEGFFLCVSQRRRSLFSRRPSKSLFSLYQVGRTTFLSLARALLNSWLPLVEH